MNVIYARALVLLALASAFVGGGSAASAQETKAQLTTLNNLSFLACGNGCITGLLLNSWNGNFLNSVGTLLDAQTWAAQQTFALPPVVAGLAGSSTRCATLSSSGALGASALSCLTGPNPTTIGHLAAWADATGTALSDIGTTLPSGLTIPSAALTGVGRDFIVTDAPFSAKCDNSTDDTVAIQAAIAASEASGVHTVLIPGKCVVTGLTVNYPITFAGVGPSSQIVLKSGSRAPAFLISIDGALWPAGPFANVNFVNLTIISPNRDDPSGGGADKPLEHGIAATNSATRRTTAINLINSKVSGLPGDNIHIQGGYQGYISLVNSQIELAGTNNLYCNSSNDWVLDGGASTIYGAEQYNIILSGCTNVKIHAVNVFVSGLDGVLVFRSNDIVFDDVTLDTSGQDSIQIQNLAGQTVTFLGGLIRWSGTNTDATYYDLFSGNTNLGTTNLFGTHFPTPASSPSSNKPAGNVGFYNASSALINCISCVFDLGPIGTAGITTGGAGKLIDGGTQGKTLVSAAQFTGSYLYNGTDYVWKLIGSSATNDGGALDLYLGGAINAQITANGASWVQGALSIGATSSSFKLGVTGTFGATSTITGAGQIMTAAAPTVAAAQIGYGSTVAANTNCGTLASSAGCIVVNVAGTTRYIPYY